MKKILFTLISMLAFFSTASAQSMKVYQNGQLKAIYYVSKDDKVEFSEDFPFPEEQGNKVDNGQKNGHEYVDLGLPSGLKWATMNIGAESPEDYGWYLAWGETEPKSTYDMNSYFDSVNGSSYNFRKYATNKKTTLDPEDDAAHVYWGGDWRMPTKEEQDELRAKCTWTWTTQNGVQGYKVSSKTNGNSLFLPAAGYRDDSNLYRAGSLGNYWSSSLNTSYWYSAYYIDFRSSDVAWEYDSRCIGLSVRAVCP